MSADLYQGIAERYGLFHGAFGRYGPAESAFFKNLFTEFKVEDVLDCACGAGRHLPLFLSLGCRVIGSDISESMLEEAKKNLACKHLEVPLYLVDYRKLPQFFDRAFCGVMCLDSSILHMPDEDQVLLAFRSMYAVLREGGILVLTQGTTDRQWREKPRFIPALNTPDFTRLFVIDYRGEGAEYHILDLWHSDQKNEFKVWSVVYPKVYLKDDQERLLLRAGFGRVQVYGGYDSSGYDVEESNRLILVAVK
ncbi:MAG: class I SAM-dependent methyltransferase [Anaerolineales bacterium]|nr:class I SAM-dependent methyltransferase [Anaerolineales bacterium]